MRSLSSRGSSSSRRASVRDIAALHRRHGGTERTDRGSPGDRAARRSRPCPLPCLAARRRAAAGPCGRVAIRGRPCGSAARPGPAGRGWRQHAVRSRRHCHGADWHRRKAARQRWPCRASAGASEAQACHSGVPVFGAAIVDRPPSAIRRRTAARSPARAAAASGGQRRGLAAARRIDATHQVGPGAGAIAGGNLALRLGKPQRLVAWPAAWPACADVPWKDEREARRHDSPFPKKPGVRSRAGKVE